MRDDRELARKLLEVLGEDSTGVFGIKIEWTVDEAMRVTLQRYPCFMEAK